MLKKKAMLKSTDTYVTAGEKNDLFMVYWYTGIDKDTWAVIHIDEDGTPVGTNNFGKALMNVRNEQLNPNNRKRK
jgi:predicted NAD-dependent protein-ADP-ribosyltransferase YbiA (DUF1768 family)